MANRKGKIVLIVENQPNYTQLLVKQILFAGLKPIVAITGTGGLRKVAECHPDLILLEVELSDMDGLSFVSEMRRNRDGDRIPIVAMSVFPHLKARCLEGGCVLGKKFRAAWMRNTTDEHQQLRSRTSATWNSLP
jgi:DNA-binding response OmpR family regulator